MTGVGSDLIRNRRHRDHPKDDVGTANCERNRINRASHSDRQWSETE